MMPIEDIARSGLSAVVYSETYGLAWQYLLEQHPPRADEIKALLAGAAARRKACARRSGSFGRALPAGDPNCQGAAREISKEWQEEEEPWLMREDSGNE